MSKPLSVATWNVQWARPGTARHELVRQHLDSIDADIVVTTEDHIAAWDRYPYSVDGGSDWGYPSKPGRRKVIAWSKEPWAATNTVPEGPARGRFVRSTTSVRGVELTVISVCIPWSMSHVTSGRRDHQAWEHHINFCEVLGDELRNSPPDSHVVIAGDFNQTAPRSRAPLRAYEALATALRPLDIATNGEIDGRNLIDHVAHSGGLRQLHVRSWPASVDGVRLTDHSGVSVSLDLRTPGTSSSGGEN